MLRLPLLVIYSMIAFNITAFTVCLQLDMLIFNSLTAKVIAWLFTIGAWSLAYIKRNKFVSLF